MTKQTKRIITLTHQNMKETWDTPILKQKDGIAVHLSTKSIENNYKGRDREYSISHIKSGGRIMPRTFQHLTKATRAMIMIARLLDWEMEMEDVVKKGKEIGIAKELYFIYNAVHTSK